METYATPTREQAGSLDDRATWPCLVPQWTTAEGAPRYVILRALSVEQKMDAERLATERRPSPNKAEAGAGAAEWWVNPWRLMVEEVRRGVARPNDLLASVVAGWNADVVTHLYTELQWVGGRSQYALDAALRRVAGEAAPPPVGAALPLDGGDAAAYPLDAPDGAAAGRADHEPELAPAGAAG